MTTKMTFEQGIQEYQSRPGAVLVDLRDPEDYETYHIPGSVNLTLSAIRDDIRKLAIFRTFIYLYDYNGKRSADAEKLLLEKGYRNALNIGGINEYFLTHKTLRQIRHVLNLSQKQLAEMIGVHAQTITNCETGKTRISKKTAELIRERLGYDVLQSFESAEPESDPVADSAAEPAGLPDLSGCTTLREIRQALKMTQTAFGASLGVKGVTISGVENGHFELSPALAGKIKEVYGVSLPQSEGRGERKSAARGKKKAAGRKTGAKAEKKQTSRKKAAGPKKAEPAAPAPAPAVVHIQSSYGREISVDEILQKTGPVDHIYIRAEEGKAYWTRGEENGAILLWP